MGEAAVAAAKTIGYVGAGTVEFLLDEDGSFFFMEMNTRLQVEHPVTEYITGQDLVEWQLRVAAGGPLPLNQDQLSIHGHAIEVRLYAEDPQKGFLSQTGRLDHLVFPPEDAFVRVDTGVRSGDAISIHYDPMIAKLIVWADDRPSAVRRLRTALSQTQVVGLGANTEFLLAIASHPAFLAADLDTGFIQRHETDLLPESAPAGDDVLAFAALGVLLDRQAKAQARAAASGDPYSPWAGNDGWRLNDDAHDTLALRDGGTDRPVHLIYRRGGYRLDLPGGTVEASGRLAEDGTLTVDLGGRRTSATIVRRGADITVFHQGGSHRLTLIEPLAGTDDAEAPGGKLIAPMPGRIIAVLAEVGAEVTKGQPLIVMEAMKMEHTIKAPAEGRIGKVRYAVGDQVEDGAELIVFEEA
jgi:3-methylcrotonyl-CoA carboxylase alpha subunit